MDDFLDGSDGAEEAGRQSWARTNPFARDSISSRELVALIARELESIAGDVDSGGEWPFGVLSHENVAFLQSLDLCAQKLKALSLLLSDYREISREEFDFRFADRGRNLSVFEN
jgi:hypothetical protein